MIARHRITERMLADLASGYGGPDAIRELWRGQQSRRLMLHRLFVERAGAAAEPAVTAIIAAEQHVPQTRGILVEPMVGAWAAETVRSTADGSVNAAQVGYLNAIATSAAVRARIDSTLLGYAPGGWLNLPTLGRFRVSSDDRFVELHARNGRLTVDGVECDPGGPGWQARRALTIGRSAGSVLLEDIDPHRDSYHVPASERLSAEEFDSWQRKLDETWQILTRYRPARISELVVGLHSLVPLQKPAANVAHSATSNDSVGVVGMDLPRHAADFAVALIHEFQHSKLAAVLNIAPLYQQSEREFFAPWRTDPRPIGGLLHGVYAFIGVADTWLALAADPASFPEAEREFAEARAQVADALETVRGSGLLTQPGERFVEGMTYAVKRLYATDVTANTDAAARRLLQERRTTWERANLTR